MSRYRAEATAVLWLPISQACSSFSTTTPNRRRNSSGRCSGDFAIEEAYRPPESGGQRDREAYPARGGSLANLVMMRLGNHPSPDLDYVAIGLPS